MELNDTDWFRGEDGFYYQKNPVASDGIGGSALTSVLIQRCAPVAGQTPDGCGLNVEIIAQTIQALGTTDAGNVPAGEDAWGVRVVNGQLQP